MQNEQKQQKVFLVGFGLIFILVVWLLVRPMFVNWKERQKNKEEQMANEEILKAPSITADDLYKMIQGKSKLFVVDISSADDFGQGHIIAAVNAPAESLNKSFLKGIGADSAAEICITNQGGDLAALAALVNKIVSDGFPNAKYLRGGIADWQAQGYPLVSSSGSEEINSSKVKRISMDDLKKNAVSNPDQLQFLDVRDRANFAKGHIVGAINIPLTELETRQNEISAVKKVIVYGANDADSFRAAATLFDLNFFNTYQMQGTIENWKSVGGKVE